MLRKKSVPRVLKQPYLAELANGKTGREAWDEASPMTSGPHGQEAGALWMGVSAWVGILTALGRPPNSPGAVLAVEVSFLWLGQWFNSDLRMEYREA